MVPPNTKIVAIIRGLKLQAVDKDSEPYYENGYKTEEKERATIFIDGLPKNEIIFCFGSHSDIGAPLSISPYVISTPSKPQTARAAIHAFPNAARFFHRIRVI